MVFSITVKSCQFFSCSVCCFNMFWTLLIPVRHKLNVSRPFTCSFDYFLDHPLVLSFDACLCLVFCVLILTVKPSCIQNPKSSVFDCCWTLAEVIFNWLACSVVKTLPWCPLSYCISETAWVLFFSLGLQYNDSSIILQSKSWPSTGFHVFTASCALCWFKILHWRLVEAFSSLHQGSHSKGFALSSKKISSAIKH